MDTNYTNPELANSFFRMKGDGMLTVNEKAITRFKELIEDEKGVRIFMAAGG